MIKGEQLYEGKAKKVFSTDDPELLIVDYKDDATAFNGLKKGTIQGKGVITSRLLVTAIFMPAFKSVSLLKPDDSPTAITISSGFFTGLTTGR